jgi:uncharacterized integral membrane protein
MADRPPETPGDHKRTEQGRQLVFGALVAIAIVFALLNFHEVKVNLIFGSTRWPLILVIVGCLALGLAIDRAWIRYGAWRRKP